MFEPRSPVYWMSVRQRRRGALLAAATTGLEVGGCRLAWDTIKVGRRAKRSGQCLPSATPARIRAILREPQPGNRLVTADLLPDPRSWTAPLEMHGT